MRKNDDMVSLAELKGRLRRFCEKHRIQRLDVFGSAARGEAGTDSDVDLLVTLDESSPVSVAELLEMAGEAEEVVGRPVDFGRQRINMLPQRLRDWNHDSLCTADMEHRAISRGFSGRDLGKLFNISVTRGEQSGDDSATLGSELIAMSAGEFAQKSMSSQ